MTPPPSTQRSISGWGNNLADPHRGAAGTPFTRRATAEYHDGANSPSGSQRPGARVVSNGVCKQTGSQLNALRLTDLTWLWGQFVNHMLDLVPAADPVDDFPISVPADDPVFPPGSRIPVSRSAFDPSTGTDAGNPRQQINGLSSYLDASTVHGGDEGRAAALRTIHNFGPIAVFGSELRTSPGPDGPLMPLNTAGLNNQIVGPVGSYFLAGDERANTGFGLMAIHTLFVREHNRLVASFAAGPGSNFEQVYQRARKWVEALIQAVTYEQFIPAVLGPGVLPPNTGYDPDVNATISAEFETFGFRFGHSMLSPVLQIVDDAGQVVHSVPHEQALLNIGVVQQHGIGPILNGFASQIMQEIDVSVIEAMRSIQLPGAPPLDLVALDLQRARDHGVPGYNRCRLCYGLAPHQSFDEITPDVTVAQKLAAVYADVDDVDPLIGGLAEPHVPGSTFGELLSAVLIEQFVRIRSGDRFFYENDPAFSPAEVEEIRGTTLSDIIKRNTSITSIQDNAFVLPEVDPAR